MMKVTAATFEELGWLYQRCGWLPQVGTRGIKAVDGAGKIRGMIAYCNWRPNSVFAHVATDTPMVWRYLARPTFSYPFLECGKEVLLCEIAENNPASWKLVESLGFKLLSRVARGFASDVDLLIYEMRRADCRWLGGPYGKERRTCS